MGFLCMEKFSLVTRKTCFWWVQFAGLSLIFLISFIFKFSFLSVVCGVIFSYAQMEILLRFFRGSFLLFAIKNLFFYGGLYLIIGFLDGFSFLLGLMSLLVFLAGLCLEVLIYDSL